MEYFAEYGIFLAKLLTVAVFIILIVGATIIMIRGKQDLDGRLLVKSLNEKYDSMRLLLQSQIESKKDFKKRLKTFKKNIKKDKERQARKRLYVLRFDGDIKATEVNSLREEITAVLSIVEDSDEVLLLLESTGGTIHGYGLAASQLRRLRDSKVHLTVAVDKVAASGGYMMASVANHIIAAPFAIIGSIGVLAQVPNFNRLLKKHQIDFEEITAGEYKRTLSIFGENTEKDREKFKEEIEEAHDLFKDFIMSNRDDVDVAKVATGEYWYGIQAKELNLIDEIKTSDDFLVNSAKSSEIFEVCYVRKKPITEKLISIGTRIANYYS